MDLRRSRLARRLGGPEARRRRHRRFVAAAAVLLAVAGALVLLGGDDTDDRFREPAATTCADFSQRVQQEFTLSFPDGPANDDAFAEYLGRAFVDTMDELVEALRALEPAGAAASAVDALAARVEAIRATPAEFVVANPFGEVADRFDDADLPECGSAFFPDPQ